jgi:LruC domain-containing protein
MRKLAWILPVLVLASLSLGYTLVGGKVVWTFLAGAYSGNYDSSGIPVAFDSVKAWDPAFLERVTKALPEQKSVPALHPEYLASDEAANVRLTEEADVFVSFLHEGAGNKNSFGYFRFDDATVPTTGLGVSEVVLFPNSSYNNSGGSAAGLKTGQTLALGRFPGGTRLGFFVASGGFNTTTGVDTTLRASSLFYTLQGLNPEANTALRPHTVLLYDSPTQSAVLGMEDINRVSTSCDQDFNDILFVVTANPPEALSGTTLTKLPPVTDRDKDGVADTDDAYPDDPARAFDEYLPSRGTWGTLAYEDQWPTQGDYDMNDLVVLYQYHLVTDANRAVKDVDAGFRIAARGAGNHNGFGLRLPGVSAGQVQAATLQVGTAAATAVTSESASEAVFRLFDDAQPLTPSPTGCLFFRTEPGCLGVDPPAFRLFVTFQAAVAPAILGKYPYDPFLFRSSQRGLEVHLPDHAATSLADASLLGSGQDTSDAAGGRWYKTSRNLPWALHIPGTWKHPLEKTEILQAYPDFAPWAQSGGASNPSWYILNVVAASQWSP